MSSLTTTAVDIYHGVAVTDPFRWLEHGDSDAVREWTEMQHGRFQSYMRSCVCRPNIKAQVAAMLSVDTIDTPWQIGDRIFYMKRTGDAEQPCLMMEDDDSEVVLIDPNHGGSGLETISILQISPTGSCLALGTKIGGEDTCAVSFLDVTNRSLFPTRLNRGFHRGICFDEQSRYVYHAHETDARDAVNHRGVWRLDLRNGSSSEIFSAGDDPKVRIRIIAGADPDWMAYQVRGRDMRTRSFVHNPLHDQSAHLIDCPDLAEVSILRVGVRCWAVVGMPESGLKMVTFDATRPDASYWDHIISDFSKDTTDVAILGDRVCATRSANSTVITDVFDLDGKQIQQIEYPAGGTVKRYLNPASYQSGLFYKYSSFDSAPVMMHYDFNELRHDVVFAEDPPLLPKHLATRFETYYSEEGVEVPICLAWDEERVLPSPGPMIFTAYGGFGVNLAPAYSPFVLFLLRQGFRFAFANVRGGAERGSSWYAAGKRLNKPNAVIDFVAGAEWLIRQGFTTAKHLAIFGGSSAGLIVSAAMTRRPDLFRVVLCLATLLDMLRYHKFDRAYRWIEEYGSSETDTDFAVLFSYSPYHAVRDNVVYPAVLFVGGELDDRSNPLHIRKMAARMQAISSNQNPVLVDISPVRGHSPTMPLSIRIESLADRLAFICTELGVEVGTIANELKHPDQASTNDGGRL